MPFLKRNHLYIIAEDIPHNLTTKVIDSPGDIIFKKDTIVMYQSGNKFLELKTMDNIYLFGRELDYLREFV
jgi:hypothetical protein